jgi:Cd2+/Zn2+-exporting ATPase/Cu+-exporting ATPase
MPEYVTIEIPIQGMDCAECVMHVEHALQGVAGVRAAQVYLISEKAVIQAENTIDLQAINIAVLAAGYKVGDKPSANSSAQSSKFSTTVSRLAILIPVIILTVVGLIVGEWFGLFDEVTTVVPWFVWLAAIIASGWPVFHKVFRAALQRQVLSHSLMSLGVIAAAFVGEWLTALMIVIFMRLGEYTEQITSGQARRAILDLSSLAPQTARIERANDEITIPLDQVQPGDIVVVRPGETIPVDGIVLSGTATVDQSSITGESLPVDISGGSRVFAATLATLGALRVKAEAVGKDSTFGKITQLVEDAESHRSSYQQLADRVSSYFLPVVLAIAGLTFVLRRDPLAVAAVLAVACSCSFALATPIAMLASIGTAARRGILIKGGKQIELLSKVDAILVDKTGTLTLGKPKIQTIHPFDGFTQNEVLQLAASAERFSEHPLGEAIRNEALSRGVSLLNIEDFQVFPGSGVKAQLGDHSVSVSRLDVNSPLISANNLTINGNTLMEVVRDQRIVGIISATDTIRPEVPEAIEQLKSMGLVHIEVITGDQESAARALTEPLQIPFRANLLPEDKINIVKDLQARGLRVLMIGDGINDAPALAQADVSIALGSGTGGIAAESASVILLKDDWMLIPEVIGISRRTMGIVQGNLIFTAVYNTVGISLAALGILPPMLAAAAQILPDLGILGNSSRLLKQSKTNH